MFTPENILLIIIVGLLLLNIQTLLTAVILLFQNIQKVTVKVLTKEEIPTNTQTIIEPYEAFLSSKGFNYLYSYQSNNMLEKQNSLQHTLYFYNEEQHIHAFVETTPMLGCLQALTISYTTLYENYEIVATYDCFAHHMKVPPSVSLFDHYHGSFEASLTSHMEDRKRVTQSIRSEAFNEEGCLNYLQYQTDAFFNILLEENIIYEKEDGYKFRLSLPYLKYIQQSVKGYQKANKALKLRKQNNQQTQNEQPQEAISYHNSEMKALAQQLNDKPTEASRQQKIKTFIFSGFAFVLVYGLLGIPWSTLPILLIVLIIHELGHYFAMQYFGYNDTSIFFIPFFGAAAKGEKEHVVPFEEYIVFLAGPLPGIIIGIIIVIMSIENPQLREVTWIQEYALFSILLNYLNLLPIYPLDGGRIVQSLLFTRYPKAQFYFFLISFVLIVSLAILLESILVALFALLLFFAINHNYKTSLLIQSIMKEPSETPLKERVLEKLSHEKTYQEISLAKKSSMAKQALKALHTQKPSIVLMFLGIGFYLLLLILPFIREFIL
ncbi:MAG: Unknown protein [uncultured Sulfurovum sp.]|uniref:Peptidase M50 domain-containing protein n=1 Tax=uncultured Sulfurovum sp. TaxID=269237 RepID=A0A6S6T422_9BACT|nr:MAG: Unknown protein [uncultured Sulfurovum sp.]